MIELASFVSAAIGDAERLCSKLSEEILGIAGMSSPKVRHLLNNLCQRDRARYLEVGVWAGSTFVSALFGNRNTVTAADAIDNFSQFGGTRKTFDDNCRRHIVDVPFTVHESGFRDVTPDLTPLVNIYFYDGDHSAADQRDAILHFQPCLANEFVLLVDDWNWPDVKCGTYEALAKSGMRLGRYWELPADYNGDTAQWWNGLFVAVINK